MTQKTYTCAMCGGTYETDWSDEEATAEAETHGFVVEECDLVCDPCYKLTPFGREADA